MMGEGKVEGMDNHWFGDDRSVDIVRGGVNEVAAREGISGGHPGPREDFPDDVKVLEEEGPASLSSR